jgi:5-methylcytosine-specific restriction enzyme A
MSRAFSAKIQAEAFSRAGGKCESCHGHLKPGQFQFDHKKPYALGGESTLENVQCLCSACHIAKSQEDIGPMRAADRKAEKSKATLKLQRAIGPTQMQRRLGITQ